MEVSIIITNYNYEKYISRAIRSAIDQNFPKEEYEIIVVDDGSTDNSKKILESYAGFIRVIYNKENIGLPKSCNAGIKQALGKYVIRLDADDYLHKDTLKVEQLFLAYNKELGAVSCDYLEIDEKEDISDRKNGEEFPIACGIMFRIDNIIDIGLYNELLTIYEDKDLRKRFEGEYTIQNIPLPLYRYRKHKGSMTA